MAQVITRHGSLGWLHSNLNQGRMDLCYMLLVTVAILTVSTCFLVLQITTRNGGPGWLPNNLNQGRLDLYYAVLVVMSVLNIFFFVYVAKAYQYKKVSVPFICNPNHRQAQEGPVCAGHPPPEHAVLALLSQHPFSP